MANLSWPNGRPKCGECGNEDVAKFKPEKAKPGSGGNPMEGINLLCTNCNTLYDMSDPANANPN
jgi:hypothetical protein